MKQYGADHLIGEIYDGVTAADGFQKFIDSLVHSFSLKAAMLFTHNVLNGEAKGMWQHGIARRWMESYALEYGREDQLAQYMSHAPIATFYASNLHLPAHAYTDSRFYREWVLPQGVRCAAGAVILREGVWSTQVVLQRSSAQPPFADQELGLLDRLVAHLQRAVQMRHRFLELQMGKTLFSAGLDVLAMPSIMADEWGRVVHFNEAATRLIEQRNGIWVEDRHLRASTLALTKQVNVEILVALGASRGSGNAVPGVVFIPRRDKSALTLMVMPMRTAAAPIKGAALLFLFDPASTLSATPELITRLFSLTGAEAELVVALCSGNTLEEAAKVRQTSIHTARAQLRSIFDKTGTRRQADLVALVLSSPAYFIARPAH